jgi:hypothetical protein
MAATVVTHAVAIVLILAVVIIVPVGIRELLRSEVGK